MGQSRIGVLLLGAALAAAPQPSKREVFTIQFAGNAAGKCSLTRGADGTVSIQYPFNDRGRGPEVQGSYRFDPGGFAATVDLAGHDYYKAPVDEHLVVADGESRWKSTSEQGQAAGPGFYTTVNGPPVEIGWLVNALQRSPDHRVKLLPGGEARLEEGPKTTLRQAGRTVAVAEFLVTGLDFGPTPVWLDSSNRFFAIAARVAKTDGDLGSIEPGKKADVVLVAGNPAANISDIRRTKMVIKNGVEFRAEQLYEALGIKSP